MHLNGAGSLLTTHIYNRWTIFGLILELLAGKSTYINIYILEAVHRKSSLPVRVICLGETCTFYDHSLMKPTCSRNIQAFTKGWASSQERGLQNEEFIKTAEELTMKVWSIAVAKAQLDLLLFPDLLKRILWIQKLSTLAWFHPANSLSQYRFMPCPTLLHTVYCCWEEMTEELKYLFLLSSTSINGIYVCH